MRIKPDDDIYRIHAVFLGPSGWTLPFTARYAAYGVWLLLFTLIMLFKAVTPLSIGLPPLWEAATAVGGTVAIMNSVTHDRPLRSIWSTTREELRTARVRPLRVWLWSFVGLLVLSLTTSAAIQIPPLWQAIGASLITWMVTSMTGRPTRPERAVARIRLTVRETA